MSEFKLPSKWEKYALTLQSLTVQRLKPEPEDVVNRVVNGHYDCFDSIMYLFPDKENKKILVTGMGEGHELEALSRHGFNSNNIYGITLIRSDVELCNLYFKNKFKNISISDLHNTKFTNEKFDLVISKHNLEHSISPYLALWEMNRVLKNGGILFLEVPVEYNDRIDPFSTYYEKDTHTYGFQHICCLYPVQVLNLTLKTGFRLINYYKFGGGFDYILIKDLASPDEHYQWMKDYLTNIEELS